MKSEFMVKLFKTFIIMKTQELARKQKGFTVNFDTVSNHCIDDFKTRIGKIVTEEIKSKKIKIGDLQRQLKSFGYNYPIYRV